MITLTQEQMLALTEDWERRQRETFVRRLQTDRKIDVSSIAREELLQHVSEGWKAAKLISIQELDDVFRFLRLRYVPESIWRIPGLQEMMTVALCEEEVPASRRLTFVEVNIAFRQPS